ncbi:hypothetical protein Tsubulata_027235 [Turnera subulata]|uniref:TF-B3 domain-containing protein n=1 Tax=Turnera subulata TaxID=218843 RepID=A0A9Q0F141_9ROSI|nr:hypothetical protein Tsubulata_027235 [Turnera subulata]
MAVELFTKELSSTDVTYRLAVPTRALHDHFHIPEGENEIEVLVKDSSDQDWEFMLSIRPNHPNLRPVFIGEWMAFVRSKGIMEGDRVILYKQYSTEGGDDGWTYSIKAERNMFKLFGTDIWVDVDEIDQ